MRSIDYVLALFFLLGISQSTFAQNDTTALTPELIQEAPFYYYVIGNWKNGPEVLMSPPFVGSEQKTMDQMIQEVKNEYSEFKGVNDVDIVIEPSKDVAEHSIKLLTAKYKNRGLKVKLLPKDTSTTEHSK